MKKLIIIIAALVFASCTMNTDTTEMNTCKFIIEMEYVDGAIYEETYEKLPSDIILKVVAYNGVYVLVGETNQCWICGRSFIIKAGVLRYKVIKRECK